MQRGVGVRVVWAAEPEVEELGWEQVAEEAQAPYLEPAPAFRRRCHQAPRMARRG